MVSHIVELGVYFVVLVTVTVLSSMASYDAGKGNQDSAYKYSMYSAVVSGLASLGVAGYVAYGIYSGSEY